MREGWKEKRSHCVSVERLNNFLRLASLRYLLHRNSRFKLSVNLRSPLCLSSLTSSLANYRNCPAALASLINSECDIGRLLFTKINCCNIKFNRTLHRVIAILIIKQFLTLGINFTIIYLSSIQNKLCITFVHYYEWVIWCHSIFIFDSFKSARKYCKKKLLSIFNAFLLFYCLQYWDSEHPHWCKTIYETDRNHD